MSTSQQPHPEPDNLPCPRCDSTNTKFCYYNNYNLAQPRYFCKSCRRFWTRGGTLRNVPVGGGSRKNSKRSRSSSATAAGGTAAVAPPLPYNLPHAVVNATPLTEMMMMSPLSNDVELDLNDDGSFTSLLTANNNNGGSGTLMGLTGYGLGLGFGSSGFEEIGFGFGACMSDENQVVVGQNDGTGTWQFGNGDGVDGSDCFAWSDLAISTAGKGLE